MDMTRTQSVRTPSTPLLWLAWVIATLLGTIAGGLLGFPLGWSIGETLMQAIGELPALFVVGLVMGGVLIGAVALAQSIVLRGRLPVARRWVLLSAVAGATGFGVILLVMNGSDEMFESALLPAAVFAVLGLWLGAAQWLALRRYMARAAWWIAFNAVGLGLTLAILFGLSAEGRELVSLVLSGLLLGTITGAGMAWLLRDIGRVSS